MAMEMGVLEAIGTNKGQPVTARALSKTTGYDTLLISKDSHRTNQLIRHRFSCGADVVDPYSSNYAARYVCWGLR